LCGKQKCCHHGESTKGVDADDCEVSTEESEEEEDDEEEDDDDEEDEEEEDDEEEDEEEDEVTGSPHLGHLQGFPRPRA